MKESNIRYEGEMKMVKKTKKEIKKKMMKKMENNKTLLTCLLLCLLVPLRIPLFPFSLCTPDIPERFQTYQIQIHPLREYRHFGLLSLQ